MGTESYIIVGRKNGRCYRSKPRISMKVALKHAYAMVYKKDGHTKRKNGLTDWHIETVGGKK